MRFEPSRGLLRLGCLTFLIIPTAVAVTVLSALLPR